MSDDFSSFRILGINHLGIAPKDPLKAKNFFENILSLASEGSELVKDQKVLTSFFATQNIQESEIGPRIEILEDSSVDKSGPIAKFLDKKGGGIHHIALQVDNIDKAIVFLKKQNIRLIDETPRVGAHKTKIVFIHPESTGGILVELTEQAS